MAPQKMQRWNNGYLQEGLSTSKKIWRRVPRNPASRNGFSLGFLFPEKGIHDIQYGTNRHARVVHWICSHARIYTFPLPEPFQKVLPATSDVHARLGRTEKAAGRVKSITRIICKLHLNFWKRSLATVLFARCKRPRKFVRCFTSFTVLVFLKF